jgi:hypothetical protein
VKIVLILTENWTMRPVPDVADLVTFAIEAERAGLDAVMVSEHIVLGPFQALAAVPAQLARGFTTICVKPSQFTDETAAVGAFCRSLAAKAAALGQP